METLVKLDELVTQIALALHGSAPDPRWARQAYRIAVPEDGSYRAEVYSYWSSDGSVSYDFHTASGESRIGQLAMTHWRRTIELGFPRWYTMTVRVERTGKFTVNFEYLEEYPEEGIRRPVPHPEWAD